MILEHWIRPAREGGVECYLHTASGCVLQARAPTVEELRAFIERWLSLTAAAAEQPEPQGAR
jgi:hypothetical protein